MKPISDKSYLLKEISSLLLSDKNLVFQYFLTLIISSTSSLLLPKAIVIYIQGNFIELGSDTELDYYSILRLELMWTLVFVAGSIATYFRKKTIDQVDLLIKQGLKLNYFKELLKKNIDFFSGVHTGSLTFQISREINEVSDIFTTEMAIALKGSIYFVGGVFMILSYNYLIIILAIVPMGALMAAGKAFAMKLRVRRRELARMHRKFNSYTLEVFKHIKTVKLFTAEPIEILNFTRKITELLTKSMEITQFSSYFYSSIEFIAEIGLICILAFGIYIFKNFPTYKLSNITTIGVYGLYCAMGFRSMLSGYSELQKGLGIYEKIFKILLDPRIDTTSFSSPNSISDSTGAEVILSKVSFAYPTRESPALTEVSFHIKPNEICAIIGPSGHGKTTLFNLLTRLYIPTNGEIYINNVNILTMPASWTRDKSGVVTQEALLFKSTLLENLQYSNHKATRIQIETACKRAQIFEFINELPKGFDTKLGENGFSLSGGQRQRVCIARALIKEPEILLLDEATSGLDPASEKLIQKVLEDEVKSRKFTVIIITHRVSSLEGLADKIFMLRKGRIEGEGNFEQLKEISGFLPISHQAL